MWRRRREVNLLDTDEMDLFFEKLDRMNQAQLLSMRAAWYATSRDAHADAWTTVRAVAARNGWTREIDRVRAKAMSWITRGTNTIPYQMNDDFTWQQVKNEAGEAIVDAALAISLGSRLDAPTHALLIEPWLRATGAEE
jgi:hypothetical protein